MKILGIAAFYHDSSACLIENGQIIAACQEERFSRIKHDPAFPSQSILFCLKKAGCKATDIDHIVFYEKPFLKFERLLETYLAFPARGFSSFRKAIPLWLKEKLFQRHLLEEELTALGFQRSQFTNLLFSTHHLSHAASAFYPSPFDEALVLTMDGVGEWDTSTVYIGRGSTLTKMKELHFPHSLGLLYSAFTYYCGFKVNSGEYKLMGLAPYGRPRFTEAIKENLIEIKVDGSFRLNMKYFNYGTGLTMTNRHFDRLFGFNYRLPESELTQVHMDLAASIQAVAEEIILKMCHSLRSEFNIENLCLAGGVALNCVANGKIQTENIFKNIWVQPAAGDAGGSLGAALAAHHLHLTQPRVIQSADAMGGAYLGPSYNDSCIEEFLTSQKALYKKMTDDELLDYTTTQLAAEKVVGWFQGRSEFGPRALGNRSILADPRSAGMQKKLNLKIKFRESFRPFAPAVTEEDASAWFNFKATSPYMLIVANVSTDRLVPRSTQASDAFGLDLLNQVRSVIPAVTHLDNSARLQTVGSHTNPRFHALIKKFGEKTGTPILINTSFNIRGEPIVETPHDAYRCFMGTGMDILVLGNFVLLKEEQPPEQLADYKESFSLD